METKKKIKELAGKPVNGCWTYGVSEALKKQLDKNAYGAPM